MKVVLRDLPDTACDEYCSITRVVHDLKSCTVYLLASPSGRQIEIEFGGVVGVKVLDEGDFPQFWRCNLKTPDQTFVGLVAQVMSGGWLQSEEIQASRIPGGYYGDVAEYLVDGDYEAVNVLCAAHPRMRVIQS